MLIDPDDFDTVVKVDQTIFADDPKRPGNCVAACIATMLQLPLSRVPHFVEFGITWGDSDDLTGGPGSGGNAWWGMLHGFVLGRGYWIQERPADELCSYPGELVLVAGRSPRGLMHQVIYRDGVLWHDPHPSRDGILEVVEVLALFRLGDLDLFDHDPTPQT